MEEMEVTEMSELQLKAGAYERIVLIQRYQTELTIIQNEMQRRANEVVNEQDNPQ